MKIKFRIRGTFFYENLINWVILLGVCPAEGALARYSMQKWYNSELFSTRENLKETFGLVYNFRHLKINLTEVSS